MFTKYGGGMHVRRDEQFWLENLHERARLEDGTKGRTFKCILNSKRTVVNKVLTSRVPSVHDYYLLMQNGAPCVGLGD